MTKCNFCRLNDLKSAVKYANLKVTTLRGEMGGVNIYIHPKDINIGDLKIGERATYKKAWFAELPRNCCCSKERKYETG